MITENSAASQCTQVVARVYFAHQLVRECSAAGSVGLSSPLPALRSRDTILHKVKDHPCYKLGIMLAECPGLLLVWLGGNPKSQYGLMLDNTVNRVCLVPVCEYHRPGTHVLSRRPCGNGIPEQQAQWIKGKSLVFSAGSRQPASNNVFSLVL
jgi:hypothetical protein